METSSRFFLSEFLSNFFNLFPTFRYICIKCTQSHKTDLIKENLRERVDNDICVNKKNVFFD